MSTLQLAPERADATFALHFESLRPEPFSPLFLLSDAELFDRGMRRVIASPEPGIHYPCRVSLDYPQGGEELLLVNHRHLDRGSTPYRAEGPVFVRRLAKAYAATGEFPPIILQREMAVRAYDAEGMMIEADLAAKDELKALTRAWLGRPDVAHVDFHSARRGCFFCRVFRA